jgi:DNA polymerase III, delta subunit
MNLISEKIKNDQNFLKNNDGVCGAENILKLFAKNGSFLFVGNDRDQIEAVLEILIKKAADLSFAESYCGQCQDCQLIVARQHPDIYWIQPKGISGAIKIEDIRVLNEKINLKPFQIQRKIFIIQDAQRMGIEASNALLKTLEEPPKNASIVLIAKSATELLPTIVSRCKLVRFSQNGTNLAEDQQLINGLIDRFFEQEDIVSNQNLYEDIGGLDRSFVEQFLAELAYIMRDILVSGLKTDKVQMISSQSIEKINQWAGFFDKQVVPQLLEQVLKTKDCINKNANIKLAIDLLVKSINKYKFKNN